MFTALISLIILAAILLVLVVLVQNPKGGGLSSQFGGGGAAQIMGVKKTGDFLEQLTWGLALSIMILTLATNFFIEEPTEFIESPNIESANEQTVSPNTFPTPPTEENTNSLDLGTDSVN